MKLNKKACRKFSNPGLKVNKRNGLLHAQQVTYLVRTAIKIIDRHRVLVLYIYNREQLEKDNIVPELVMFQSKTDYITLARLEDGTTRWRTAIFDNMKGSYFFSDQCAFYSTSDEARVVRFCGYFSNNGFSCLNRTQESIQRQRQVSAKKKEELRIIEKMKVLKALPRNLKSWIHQEIMPYYIFYTYQKGKKSLFGYCTGCQKEVQVEGAKHNKEGICPECHKKVTFKSRGKRGYLEDRNTLQVFQRLADNEMVVRVVKVYYNYYSSEIPSVSVYEAARIFVKWDDAGNVSEERYYSAFSSGDLTPWKRGDRPILNRWYYNFNADSSGYLYHKNLDEVLSNTPWKYSQLKEYYLSEPEPLYALRYLYTYQKYPMIEYLVKLHLYRLATAVAYNDHGYYNNFPINLQGKSLKEILGVEKAYIPLLQKVNPGTEQLQLIQKMIQNGIRLDEELLKWCSDRKVSRVENLTVPLQYMTSYKFIRYAEEQYELFHSKSWNDGGYRRMEDLLNDYRDYICMSEGLNYDMHNNFILFPARLPEAHDKVNDLSDKEMNKAYNRQIKKQFGDLKIQYGFAKYGFIVRPPLSADEIVKEGHELHHCVGGYVKKVVKKESIILFVRKKDEPSNPLCTLEVKDGELMQARTYRNGAPSKEIQRFLDVWEKEVLYIPALKKVA